jgi:hypothetical protein
MTRKFLEVKIDGYIQIDTTHIIDVDAPTTEEPFWTIYFEDGERINTTFPVIARWKVGGPDNE